MGHGQIFRKMHCQIIEAVSANAFGGWQVVVVIDVDAICIFVELVMIRFHCP